MADEENKVPENDDWLNDLDSEPEFASVDDGLDSSAFDKMFGELHSSDTPAPEPVKAAGEVIPEEEAAPESLPESLPAEPAPAEESVAAVATEKGAGQEELGVELDQSNIDSLLNEVEESADAPTEEEAAPLDQSSIDALMGGGDAAAASAEPEEAVAEKPTETAAPPVEAVPEPVAAPPQPVQAADASPADIVDDGGELPAAADLPPIEDLSDPDNAFIVEGDELDDLFGDTSGSPVTLGGSGTDTGLAFAEEEDGDTAGGTTAGSAVSTAGSSAPAGERPAPEVSELNADTVLERTAGPAPGRFNIAALLADKKVLGIGGGVIAALLFMVIALFLRSGPEAPVVQKSGGGVAEKSIKPVPPQVKPAPPTLVADVGAPRQAVAEKKVNSPPKAIAAQALIPITSDQVKIVLAGEDPDHDVLNYEVTSLPAHGTLSGDPPGLLYTAGNDFSGADSFTFRVTDPGGVSEPAVVKLRRAKVGRDGIKIIEPRRSVFRTVSAKLETTSTSGNVEIDGRKLWQKANPGVPLDRKARFELKGRPVHVKISKVAPLVYRYTPEPYDTGSEEFSFRFINRGVRGKEASLEIAVANGNPPPDIRLTGFVKQFFQVGDRVVIDASPTRDDQRSTVRFRWLQNQGVSVRLERLNEEGSRVAFIMPSYFYTTNYPEPVLIVEARDASGQVASKEVRVPVRRSVASETWDGLHLTRGKPADPGRLLPWGMTN